MPIAASQRLQALPPYIFAELHRRRRAAIDAGRDVIDFGVGDPDRPTHAFIIDRMTRAIRDPKNHLYALGGGTPAFRQQMAAFFADRYGVELDAARELLALVGTKEGIGHLPLAVVNPGQTVLVPSPGYPVYQAAAIFAGAKPYVLKLEPDRGWLPDLDAVSHDVTQNAALLFLNYPNNPTGAVATREFFERAVAFARERDLLVAHDAAYNELYLDDQPPPSILQVSGARDVAIEFHSASKTFNMTGWRVGFVAGNPDVIAALAAVKANFDSGVFGAVQEAAAEAFQGIDRPEVREIRSVYRSRAELLCQGLQKLGFQAQPPAATFYVWARVPPHVDSMSACNRLLDEADIVGVPGIAFGPTADDHVRFSLGVPAERIKLAVERMGAIQW